MFGIGPVPAVRQALERAGWSVGDVERVEINEAFAAIAIAVYRELGFAEDVVNVEGGAIAHGHPIGATGAILTTRLLHSMKRDGLKRGVVTLCIGGGQGIALALSGRMIVGRVALALDRVRVADDRCLGHLHVRDERALDLGGAHAVTGDVNYVGHPAGDPVVAVGVAPATVAREVETLAVAEVSTKRSWSSLCPTALAKTSKVVPGDASGPDQFP